MYSLDYSFLILFWLKAVPHEVLLKQGLHIYVSFTLFLLTLVYSVVYGNNFPLFLNFISLQNYCCYFFPKSCQSFNTPIVIVFSTFFQVLVIPSNIFPSPASLFLFILVMHSIPLIFNNFFLNIHGTTFYFLFVHPLLYSLKRCFHFIHFPILDTRYLFVSSLRKCDHVLGLWEFYFMSSLQF